MVEREKVIKGIGICVAPHSNCDECPYNEDEGYECINRLRADALAILAEPEARVMSVGDLKAVSGTTATVFVEERRGMRYSEMAFVYIERVYGEDVMFHGQKSIFGHVVKEYGKTWRAWTLEPTKKQMEEMAWDG